MATVGSLNVMVGANIKGLNRGLGKAAKRINKFGSSVGKVGAKMAKFGAAGAAVGTAIGGAFTKQAISANAELGRLAARTGASAKELSRLQFQRTGAADR
jgi:hypothetical protein